MLLLVKTWYLCILDTARDVALQLTVTREPCWLTASPSTFLRAACSRWVAVWLLRARRLMISSTVAVTCRMYQCNCAQHHCNCTLHFGEPASPDNGGCLPQLGAAPCALPAAAAHWGSGKGPGPSLRPLLDSSTLTAAQESKLVQVQPIRPQPTALLALQRYSPSPNPTAAAQAAVLEPGTLAVQRLFTGLAQNTACRQPDIIPTCCPHVQVPRWPDAAVVHKLCRLKLCRHNVCSGCVVNLSKSRMPCQPSNTLICCPMCRCSMASCTSDAQALQHVCTGPAPKNTCSASQEPHTPAAPRAGGRSVWRPGAGKSRPTSSARR